MSMSPFVLRVSNFRQFSFISNPSCLELALTLITPFQFAVFIVGLCAHCSHAFNCPRLCTTLWCTCAFVCFGMFLSHIQHQRFQCFNAHLNQSLVMASFVSQRLPTECSPDLTARSFLNVSTAKELDLTGTRQLGEHHHAKRALLVAIVPTVMVVTMIGIIIEAICLSVVRKLGFNVCRAISVQAGMVWIIGFVFVWAAVSTVRDYRYRKERMEKGYEEVDIVPKRRCRSQCLMMPDKQTDLAMWPSPWAL